MNAITQEANVPNVELAVRTLIANGFVPDGARRHTRYTTLHFYCREQFGGVLKYTFALCEGTLSEAEAKTLTKEAAARKAVPVVVADAAPLGMAHLEWKRFLGKLGGPVDSSICFEDEYGIRLRQLAENTLPEGCSGKASDLLEDYVYAGLQFLLAGRLKRFGNNMLGKPLPDGMWFCTNQPTLLYDAKASAKGYHLGQAAVRQFSEYVGRFRRRYADYLEPVHSFLVVSAAFTGNKQEVSDDLYAECRVKMSFLTADDLARIVATMTQQPQLRRAVDWYSVFSKTEVKYALIEAELKKIRSEGILGARDGNVC